MIHPLTRLRRCASICMTGAFLLTQSFALFAQADQPAATAPSSAPATQSAPVIAKPQFRLNQKVQIKRGGTWEDATVMNYRNEWYLVQIPSWRAKEWAESWRLREMGSDVDDIGIVMPNTRRAEEGPPPRKPGPKPAPLFAKRGNEGAGQSASDKSTDRALSAFDEAVARQKEESEKFAARMKAEEFERTWPKELNKDIRKDPGFVTFSPANRANEFVKGLPAAISAFDNQAAAQNPLPAAIVLDKFSYGSQWLRVSADTTRAITYRRDSFKPNLGEEYCYIDIPGKSVLARAKCPEIGALLAISPSGNKIAFRLSLGSEDAIKKDNWLPSSFSESKIIDKQPLIAIWSAKPNGDQIQLTQDFFFLPFEGEFSTGVKEAIFADDNTLICLSSSFGRIATIDLENKKRLMLPQQNGEARLVLSPNRRMLAIAGNSYLLMIDIASRNPVARYDVPYFCQLSFTPSGRDILARTRESFVSLNLATGNISQEFAAFYLGRDRMIALSELYAIVDGGGVIDFANSIPLWLYQRGTSSDTENWDVAGGLVWALTSGKNGQTVLAAAKLPDDQALAVRTPKADENLAVRPGATISLNIDARGDTEKVRESLKKMLEGNGLKIVNDSAELKLEVKTEIGKPMNIAFYEQDDPFHQNPNPDKRTISDYKVTLQILFDGKPVYSQSYGSNLSQTRTVLMKKGQSLDQALAEMTTPRYDQIISTSIPRYCPKPGAKPWQGTSQFPLAE